MTPPTTPARVAGERLLERYALEEDLSAVSAIELFSITDELLELRAKLEAARPALEAGFIHIEQNADDYDNQRRGDGSKSKEWRAYAAVLRSLSTGEKV